MNPTPEALLAIDRDGWKLLPLAGRSDADLRTVFSRARSLVELLDAYDQTVGHLSLAPPYDLGSQVQELAERVEDTRNALPLLNQWLHDGRRPWRQYHACESLLHNIQLVPLAERDAVWDRIAVTIELSGRDKVDSDEAQVWRLEAELAANYLRVIDASGYGDRKSVV